MVKIRLRKIGRNKAPSYQIIAIDSRKSRDGKFLEKLGHYDTLSGVWKFNKAGIDVWVKKGAQLSDVVKNLLKNTKSEGKNNKKSEYKAFKKNQQLKQKADETKKNEVESTDSKPAEGASNDKPTS